MAYQGNSPSLPTEFKTDTNRVDEILSGDLK